MSSKKEPLDWLSKRLQIMDVLAGIFIPATIASLWPGLNPPLRASVFGVLVLLSLASAWWGASIAYAHKVKSPIRRILIHLYSFLCFSSFLIFVPCGIALLAMMAYALSGQMSAARLLDGGFMIMTGLFTGVLTLSMFPVERERQKALLRNFNATPKAIEPPQNNS
jgi:membrane-associated HD superfamily phosphohydrolase